MIKLIYIFFAILNTSFLLAEEPAWVLFSMNPPRGNINYFTGTNNHKLYIVGRNTRESFFISSDAGNGWIKIINNDYLSGIISVNNCLFTKGVINHKIDSNYFGIYKSCDDGKTWVDIWNNWEGSSHPFALFNDSNSIYIIVEDSLGYWTLYNTTNDGISWNYISQIHNNNKVNGFGGIFNVKNTIIVNCPIGTGKSFLYLSINSGKTWKELQLDEYVYCIQIKSDKEIYISNTNGILLTTDLGETWQPKWLNDKFIPSFIVSIDSKDIYANVSKYYSPKTDSAGILYSNDSGKTWSLAVDFKDINNNLGINLDIIDDNIYARPSKLGVYRSDNKGLTWEEKNEGFSSIAPSDFLFNDTNIFMSCWGFFKSTNQGITFDYLGLKSFETSWLGINSKGDLFIDDQGLGNTQNGISRSSDGGYTWRSLYSNIGTDAFLISNRDILLAASNGALKRSTDNGDTWEYLDPISATAIATNNEGDLFSFDYAYPGSRHGYGIFRSSDNGAGWDSVGGETMGFPSPSSEFKGKVIFNNFTKSAWFGPLANIDNSFWGIYKTTDNGRTWYSINLKAKGYNWFPSGSKVAVDSLGCWVAARGGEKYGIYRSCDNGVTWIREDTTGLPNEFGPIGVSPDGHIYVFGATGGLYRSIKKYVSVEHRIKEDIYNMIVSPNPAQEKIKVDVPPYFYDINFIDYPGELNHDIIEIYDVLGNCIIKFKPDLSDAIENQKDIEVDISGIPPGVYFLRYGKLTQKFVKL